MPTVRKVQYLLFPRFVVYTEVNKGGVLTGTTAKCMAHGDYCAETTRVGIFQELQCKMYRHKQVMLLILYV